MYKLTLIFLLLTTMVSGQIIHRQEVFLKRTNREYKDHFSPTPKDINTAISQIDSHFSDIGRNYFKTLPEKTAILQLGETLRNLQFAWKFHRVNPYVYSIRKTNSELVDVFISNGASGDFDEIIRLLMACLHRQLNHKTYAVSELYKLYGNSTFGALQYSIRDVNPKDTVFGSWFNRQKFFKAFSWSTWFEVVSKDSTSDSLKVKIVKIETGNKYVSKIAFGNKVWSVGDTIQLKNRELRNWKEIIKLNYGGL